MTRHRLNDDADIRLEAGTGEVTFTAVLPLTGPIQFTKYNLYTDSLRHGQDMIERGIQSQEELKDTTFEDLLAEQTEYLNTYWKSADVVIQNDDQLQEGIRFNLFQAAQSAGRDKHSNISAKGLSGEGYEGHYFWDTEIYMFPVFLMTTGHCAPAAAVSLFHAGAGERQSPGNGAPARRTVPVAHDLGNGMLLLLPFGNGAIPYQRRYRLQLYSVLSRRAGPGFSLVLRGRGADRNRPPLGRHRALL